MSVTYSPDGRLVATKGIQEYVHLWEASSGNEWFRFPAPSRSYPDHPGVAFAPGSSGFSTSRFVKWYDEKYGERSGREWVKAHILCGTKTNCIGSARTGSLPSER